MTSSTSVEPEFSVRIVVCDHYLTKPVPGVDVIYSEFRGSDVKQVPILRIFGSAPDGHKACLHVHGVFPYFCIPCPMPNPEPQFLYQIAASLDKALNIAMKQATSATQHVYKISLVKALPFYGFHDKEHLFLKVFLYNPGLIKQAVELCCNGAILGQTFQPHEAHLNFNLQFFIDFNLFGMSNIDLQTVRFRKSGLSQSSDDPIESFDEGCLKPESVCFYEADCVASHIINRQRIGKGDGIENPGLEEVWNQERERRKQLNVSMASKSLSQGRINIEETNSHQKFEQIMMLKLSQVIEKPTTGESNVNKLPEVHYPAESLEGSQVFNAVDVSMHLPESAGLNFSESLRRDLDDTLVPDADDTLVDESIALNSSLSMHYSQVLLDNDDLELVDLLQDMDEREVEEDSMMSTPANVEDEADIDADDAEYSQVFHDDTVLLDFNKSEEDNKESPLSWNDSFWDGANIPQLDGTFDDDHVKKVRKRKMRSFKVGLSRPRTKKSTPQLVYEDSIIKSDTEVDEIDVSRETIENISNLHLGNIKKELVSIQEVQPDKNMELNIAAEESISDLVKKVKLKFEKSNVRVAEEYDIRNNFEPQAGTSSNTEFIQKEEVPFNLSIESSPEEDQGIISFYDSSKMFDLSLENQSQDDVAIKDYCENHEEVLPDNVNINHEISEDKHLQKMEADVPKTDAEELGTSLLKNNKDKNQSNTNDTYRNIVITPKIRAPTKEYIISSLDKYGMFKHKNPDPYYSDYKDAGDKIEIGDTVLKVQSKLARDQKPYQRVLSTTTIEEWRQLYFLQTNEISEETSRPENLIKLLAGNKQCILQPVKKPPTKTEVLQWLDEKKDCVEDKVMSQKELTKNLDELENSQAIGLNEDEINSSISLETKDSTDENAANESSLQITMQPDGSFLCFGSTEAPKESSLETPILEADFLTLMLVEVQTSVRGELCPDPMHDQIQALFFTVTNECPPDHFLPRIVTEVIVVDKKPPPKWVDRSVYDIPVTYVNNESELLESLIHLIKKHDPDIMCGFEIELNSWGYILERAQILGLEIVKEISRITEKNRQKRCRNDENDFEGRIIGRVMFNVWRLLRHELALSSYSFENCMYEVMKERVPKFSEQQLWNWWGKMRWIPAQYRRRRLLGTVDMLTKLNIINRMSELSRLFGIQWWEVFTRGSQLRVESLMLRAARAHNLLPLSPAVRQRAAMPAPECLPLIFEPESRFYTDPVIVLDFQSLYPSMMIAYNYCFSTCIGKVQNIIGDSSYEFGAWRLRIPKAKLEALVKNGLVHYSPVGAGFVKPTVRRGVLPTLLKRILAARQAVKKGMKLQTDEAVKKAMHSRQLGLKLIANVTYGYTAANFSGRMPCVEVADSVVAKGRETLERAIQLVRGNAQWNAKVVYGDTDSMFVLLPGGTRELAFRVGQQIADAVTADNPSPVALKLEKVYQPCILQTKKRYVGFMYETPETEKPVYEAKGIETVRRDGCPAGVELLHDALVELFTSGDLSRVRCLVASKLRDALARPERLVFTREFRGDAAYRNNAAPPLEIAKRARGRDPRSAPRAGQRVRWLVSAGAPAAALVSLARTPAEILRAPGMTPHAMYYVTRVLLPPLNRCFSLLGVDVFKWWRDLNNSGLATVPTTCVTTSTGIARYVVRARCGACGRRAAGACGRRAAGACGRRAAGACGRRAAGALCGRCAAAPQRCVAALAARRGAGEREVHSCQLICRLCSGHTGADCVNDECGVLWRRQRAAQGLQEVTELLNGLPPKFYENGQF